MPDLPHLTPRPVPDWQRDRLRRWIDEWCLDQQLRHEGDAAASSGGSARPRVEREPPREPDPLRPAPASDDEPSPAPGQVRLLRPRSAVVPDRPVYVAVLREEPPHAWLVAAFSRFAEPAVPGEWLTGRAELPLRVLSLWNTRRISGQHLTDSWLVAKLSAAELDAALAVLDHHRTGSPVNDRVAAQIGPPLVHPFDPRHQYLQEETAALDHLLQSAVVVRFADATDRRTAELARAAEPAAPYRVTKSYLIGDTTFTLVASPVADTGSLSLRILDQAGQRTRILDGSVVRLPDGTTSPPFRNGQSAFPHPEFPPGTVLLTPQATVCPLQPRNPPRSPR